MIPVNMSPDITEETIHIMGVNSSGQGVGRLEDGSVIFVPRTVPGDTVKVTVTMKKSRWSKGRLIEIISSSLDRVEPVCEYFGVCNGCALQHMEYGAQLKWKINSVEESLKRIAGKNISVSGIEPSPQEYNYRSRLTFTLLRLPESRVVAGFHSLNLSERIEDIGETCSIGETSLLKAWKSLRENWGENARLLPAGRKLKLTLRTVDGGVALVIHGGKKYGRADLLIDKTPEIVSIWNVDIKGEKHLLAGSRLLFDERIGSTISVGATSFLQANRQCETLLNDWVCNQIELEPGMRLIDAYCGLGSYGRTMMARGVEVIGIERDLMEELHETGTNSGSLKCLKGTVENILPGLLPADAIILNPPRTGLSRPVAKLISDRGPCLAIYVSCDPATLARDLARLGEAYEIINIRLFDLFPQTPHTETVAVMHRKV